MCIVMAVFDATLVPYENLPVVFNTGNWGVALGTGVYKVIHPAASATFHAGVM
jgi:hypothetical protein